MLMLAIHRDVQDKVVAELETVFINPDESPDYAFISKLTYMDMELKETMLVITPLPFVAADITLRKLIVFVSYVKH